ncbi:hypothetical protein PS918_01920 [Pseudomonas fluorescens]|uniref:VWFA domain-containing protein n=1 Tax=Pseudomonas fluorescens TaxID=294 RepID=A0A5E7RRJ4_PSEFL|nr:retention module-containing protein [Pseudomonas fluorescens]VVP76709.1 hypothetical protein PS918_01920 [Pseudomonas fluorescens]
MATLIGIVSKVIGQVFAVASDGTRRVLIEGDRLFAGDQLNTGAEGAVAVHLQNGQELTLGRGSSLQMNAQLLAHQSPHVNTAEAVTPSQAQLSDVEQLQKAIAAGDDPTQSAEATAAGPGSTGPAGGALGGGHSFVLLEEVGGRVDPKIGFPTAGFNGIPELPEERLAGDPDNGIAAVDAPVSPVAPVVPDTPNDSNNPVTLDGLSVSGGELTLNEANLADGSARNPAALTQNGTFTVTAPDGLTSLSIGGINIVSGGVAVGFPQSITTPLGSTLTITGYNPATGVVSYSYTLNGSESHSTGDGTSLSEHFTVVAGDSNGDTATGSLDITIIDDAPKAIDDSNSGTASENQLTLNGNVLSNDIQGADRVPVGENAGPITPGTFVGKYGTLVLNANGTYTYTLNVSDADYKALHGGAAGTETFTYTLTDADGDTSTANLVLNIRNDNDGVTLNGLDVKGGELTVYEKNLSDGTSPDTPALTQHGTFTVSAPDGLQTLTVGGISVVSGGVAAGFPQSITTPLGSTLTITGYNPATGVVSYSYTLVDNETHPNANGANSLTENFNVVATDTDGSTASGQINVNIVDDLPTAHADDPSVREGGTIRGNVLDNDIGGADGLDPKGAVVGVRAGSDTSTSAIGGLNEQIIGKYGYLTLAANGDAVYHSNPNAVNGSGAVDVFTYTIRDADGDESTTTITVGVYDSCLIAASDRDVTVYEKALDLTRDGQDLAPGTVVGSQPGSTGETASGSLVGSVTGGVGAITYALVGSATGHYGQIVLNPDGSYTYTLTSSASTTPQANDGANKVSESFTYQATDSQGNTVTSTIVVNVVDDVPQAKADDPSVTVGGTIRGNVLDNDIGGADGLAAGGGVVGVRAGADTSTSAIGGLNQQIVGKYGYLTLAANGDAVYHSNPNAVNGPGAVDVFTYTIRDADGDESTTTITIGVNDSCITAVSDHDVTVYEKALDLSKDGQDLAAGTVVGSQPGSTGETASGSLVGSVTGAVGAITYALVGSANGAYGQIHLNPNGTYTYTLTSPPSTTPHANDGANVMHENFTYQATDSLGNVVTSTIVVNIVDDVPKAMNDSNPKTASESLLTLNGNVLANDVQGADAVATGPNSGPITPGTFVGTYGTLQLNANGTYTYTLNPADADFKALQGRGNGTETFTYTLTDADGDTSNAQLVLNVHNNNDPVIIKGLDIDCGELTVYEKNLSDGSHPNTPALTQSGTFTVTALDGLQTLTVGGIALVSGGVAAGIPQSIVTHLGNTLTITGYNPVTGVVSYSYTLVDNETHESGKGANTLTEDLNVVAVDTDGSRATGQINVNIVDDLPTARADTPSVVEGGTISGNVLDNDIGGADGIAAVIGVRAGGNPSKAVVGGLNTQIIGKYGYLTLDADGSAVYHSNPDSVGKEGATDVFTYTVRDADGDQSTTTITIDVCNAQIKAIPDTDVTVYEKALDLSKDGQDLAAGTVTGSDPGNTGETASGTLVGSVTGASGAINYTLVGSATGTYGQLLLNANGTYTYTLTSAPKTSPGANDGPNTLSDTFTYKATDAQGTSTTSTIVVNIVDDVPRAVATEHTIIAAGTDTNLLLVIDVSASMNELSGVGRLSRLEWAKQAISTLLDKYDDLGDVKVQIVTFGSHANDPTSLWVDVATAKSIIAGLKASGGTDYDEAVKVAKDAFDNDGKLTGAQNVGYFFSDGKPNEGSIGTRDEADWKEFLTDNHIKNYAIGLGKGVDNDALDPLAYDGNGAGTNTNAVIVTELGQLNAVLSGTVVGAALTGSLLGEGGSFGADGGFIKTITIDGTTYTYDPRGNSNDGALTASGGPNHGTFNTLNNTLSIATGNNGTLVVNLDTGEYSYVSQKTTSVALTENIAFTVSDHDGDLANSSLVVKVTPNAPPLPVAGDDHIITNILSAKVTVPGDVLVANDVNPDGSPLSATPTTFNTGWAGKGSDLTGSGAISFTGIGSKESNQILNDVRSSFAGNAATMTALLVISGYLGPVTAANINDEDRITVNLKQGETLNLDHNLADGHITMQYSTNGVDWTTLGADPIIAASDAAYQIQISNVKNPGEIGAGGSEKYELTLKLDYSAAHDLTPDYHGTYTTNDGHGGSASGNVSISYQDGHTLTGTGGDDTLLAGSGDNLLQGGDGNDILSAGDGNNELHGDGGNDLLFSGTGNDLLDGGTGNDTVSYAHAMAGVTVNLGETGAQNTFGAGTDTLTAIENLVGSSFNDKLTGDDNSNVITGGLGNDVLNGEGGDDFLIGGLGNNTLTGGSGADTFQWLKGNSGHDVITDFTPGTDKLDLSQLLQGENSTAASLDDYLHFKVIGSGESLVTSIDVSALAGAAPNQTIDLAGINLASHYGVTPGAGGVVSGADSATIINGMLNDHSLKVDTV